VLFLVRGFALGRLARRTALIAQTLRIRSILWALAASLAIALRYVHLSGDERKLAGNWIVAFLIVSLTLAAATATVRALTLYGQRHEKPFVVAGLLTALGVGGLAVALALQGTLANFFAGIQILVEEPISVGDSSRLSSHEEGVVTDIGWRTTRVLTNPQTPILVGLNADPDVVARIAMEEAHAVPGLLPAPTPALFFDPGVTVTHMQFRLDVAVPNQPSAGSIQSQLRVALLRRFRREGFPLPEIQRIEIPGA